MLIRSVRHKGLRRFIVDDVESGVPANYRDKLRKMVSFLQEAQSVEELKVIPAWHAHVLSGDRRGVWALHVSPNWRLTFRVDPSGPEIFDLDLEDYH